MKFCRAKRVLRAVPVLIMSFGAAGPASAAAPMYRNVANVAPGRVAWIHTHPTTASPRIGYLESGALRVRTFNCRQLARGGWCQVTRRGTRGWVQDRFLKADTVMRS